LIVNKIFHVTVLLVVNFCDQFVAPEIRQSQQMSLQWLSTINVVVLVGYSATIKILIKSLYLKGYMQRVGATTTSPCVKGSHFEQSLTNWLFPEPANATTQHNNRLFPA